MNAIKFLCIVTVLAQFSIVQATWIIVKIDNQSDLTFLQAARADQNVEIESISHKLKNPEKSDSHIISLDAQDLFGSSGACKIIAQTPEGQKVSIAFFGDPTHKVANGRVRHADVDSRNAAASCKKSRLARVFFIQSGDIKFIGSAGYEEMNHKFSLKLMGTQGDYQAKLM